jgi:pimeloyl-ACP methyl ester carboxylesterase
MRHRVTEVADEMVLGVNGVDLCYQSIGDPNSPPLLMIMGLSAPLTWWDDDLCQRLADQGFRVIRFDNRDCGRSSKLTGQARIRDTLRGRAPYTLTDMAEDTAALVERLELDRVHVVGASMGAMIGQILAIRRPDLVASLTSIMSTTGNRKVGHPSLRGVPALFSTAPQERDAYIEHHLRLFRRIGSRGFALDEPRARRRAALTFDRGLNPAGTTRQRAAVMAAKDRTSALRQLALPTAVIHGTRDPMVSVSGGIATARAITGSELVLIDGMGHNLPSELFPRFADVITRTAARAT